MADIEYKNGALCANKINISDEVETYSIDNPEWMSVTIDSSNKIIEGFKIDGTKFIGNVNITEEIKNVNTKIDDVDDKLVGYKTGTFNLGSNEQSDSSVSLVVSNGEKIIGIPISEKYEGNITNVSFYCTCSSSFIMTLGVGIVDQRNWGLIYRRKSISVINGLNNIYLSDFAINQGEQLFIVADSSSSAVNANIYKSYTGKHQISDEGDITVHEENGEILIKYTINGKMFIESNIATKQDITNLSTSLSELSSSFEELSLDKLFIQSPDSTYYKLKVANDGSLSTEIMPVMGDILIMGNSYDVHNYAPPVWWGDFGMAASRKENDWKHQLLSMLRKNDGLIYTFTKQAIAHWETKWNKTDDTVEDIFEYNDTNLPALAGTPNYSMVIIRVGENNTDTNYDRVQLRVYNLLNYITSKVGNNVPIVLGACIKVRTEQNQSFINAASEFDNVTYVDMTPAGRLGTFAAGLDYKVFGDDGIWHTISESSMASAVAGHPNDTVFAKVAELFYPIVFNKLID